MYPAQQSVSLNYMHINCCYTLLVIILFHIHQYKEPPTHAMSFVCTCCLLTSGLLAALTAACQALTTMMKLPPQQQQQPLETHRHRLAVALTIMSCAVLISRQGPPGQPQMVLDLFPMMAAAGSLAAALLRSWQV
jgi:Na+/H+ antiporter NhaA